MASSEEFMEPNDGLRVGSEVCQSQPHAITDRFPDSLVHDTSRRKRWNETPSLPVDLTA
jgi:hypothetical protein